MPARCVPANCGNVKDVARNISLHRIPEFTSQFRDSYGSSQIPNQLGTGTKYRHIQKVTENQGFY